MADYAAIADLQAFLPAVTISASTVPTTTQATGYLTLITAEINGILAGRGYSIAQTDSDALAYLKTVCLNGSAVLVLQAKHPTNPDIAVPYRESYQKALDDIRSGRVLIPDATTVDVSIGEGMTTDSDGETWTAPVTRGMEW